MAKLSLRITEETNTGKRRSFRAGSDDSASLVISLSSEQGVVGCLTLQYDDSGRPVIRLKRERGFEFRIESFAQTRLFNFGEVKK
jgi:hypothetical protein